MLTFNIITIFPNYFDGPFSETIIKRAQDKGLVKIVIHNLRDFSNDKHGSVDDKPFGGGAGMLMKVEPFYRAINSIDNIGYTILTSPKGKFFDQNLAYSFLDKDSITILCGRYEGVDNRVSEHLIDSEISVGNYTLSGGEPAAISIIDTVTRLIPGVLGNEESLVSETYSKDNTPTRLGGSVTRAEYPQYTRPAVFKTNNGEEWNVPKVLLSGNHQEIENWKEQHTNKR